MDDAIWGRHPVEHSMEGVLVAVGIGADVTAAAARAGVEVVNGQVQYARPEPLDQRPRIGVRAEQQLAGRGNSLVTTT